MTDLEEEIPDSLAPYISAKTGLASKIIITKPTGAVGPAWKRDRALNFADGEILAFIDDDAYPHKDWLRCAVKNFEDPEVAAVGGPAVTPGNDILKAKASGLVFSSLLVSGNYSYRYLVGKRQEVDDYPSCNFLVRKSVMRQIGGFNTKFWPGEDTIFCLDITKKLKKKIIYDPTVLVYHHRRQLFGPHLRQVSSYALHRGYFVKKFPETSLKISYFLPSIFVLGLALGPAVFFVPLIKQAYFFGLFLYLFLVFGYSFSKGLRLITLVFFGIILTHCTYGIFFLKGLISKRLSEEK